MSRYRPTMSSWRSPKFMVPVSFTLCSSALAASMFSNLTGRTRVSTSKRCWVKGLMMVMPGGRTASCALPNCVTTPTWPSSTTRTGEHASTKSVSATSAATPAAMRR